MPDATILSASQKFLDVGVVGAVAVFLLAALLWMTKQWLAALSEKDKVQELRLAEVREFAKISEDMRNVMSANTVAIQSVLSLYREHTRA